uniref:Uncharacterized protein n=1 Tax=Oryza rufipogon TaxID=4529 RepID=A0A0E0R9S4_ORYRU
MAQQQISNLCSFCGGDRRGLTVAIVAASPLLPFALPSFKRLFVFLVQFSIMCILLSLLTMFGGLPS